MAIEDTKTIEIRGKSVRVFGEHTAPRAYVFSAICQNIVRQINVTVGDGDGNIAGNDAESLQKGIDWARQTIAERVVSLIEHNELKVNVD